MTKSALLIRGLLTAVMLLPVSAFASGSSEMPSAQIDLGDKGSLQRGAGLFMNYCASCHSISYMRYSRLAEDLDLSQEQVEKYLMPAGAKFGETINTGMNPADATKWFGKAPPDLSVVARTKAQGADWIYNYLKSFYVDESRPSGWNNTVFPGASMPNVLWQMQGYQHAETKPKHKDAKGVDIACHMGEFKGECIEHLTISEANKGTQSAEEFDRTARDISAFLAYVGEPSAMKRESLGVWVVLFLSLFTLLAYLLKTEYWQDVH